MGLKREELKSKLMPKAEVAIDKMLGSVDISAQPDQGTDELDEAEITVCQFVKAGEHAPKMLDLADKTLD